MLLQLLLPMTNCLLQRTKKVARNTAAVTEKLRN